MCISATILVLVYMQFVVLRQWEVVKNKNFMLRRMLTKGQR